MYEKAITFASLPSQWEIHLNPERRQRWISEAEKWQDRFQKLKRYWKKFASKALDHS